MSNPRAVQKALPIPGYTNPVGRRRLHFVQGEIAMEWFLSNWPLVVQAVLAVIGGASVAVKLIAPLTSTKLDDKLAGILSKVHSLLSKLALN